MTQTHKFTPLLVLTTLGIVYGDIGTSPLYAIREVFFGHHAIPHDLPNVLGTLSLFFWSLAIVVALKYHVLVLRLDNHGEGGVFALFGIIRNSTHQSKLAVVVSAALVFGACLLYADGMLTPAISVLSAVEGIEVVTPAFKDMVIPITILILIVLFFFQKRGTDKVGRLFGPVMIVWFSTLVLLAIPHLHDHPEVFEAVNPMHAIRFLSEKGVVHSMQVLGYVFLCVTGGEALYADLGHFGKHAIDTAWFSLVFPALVINYFGQGAFLLGHSIDDGSNLFYLLAPQWALIPLVILATMATIIASQAVISGAFSLTQQAVGLGFFPRLKIIHTSSKIRGQIYMPFVNWLLCLGCIALVLGFKTSSGLASAYGITVSMTMMVTTMGLYIVATKIWGWNAKWVTPLCLLLLFIDISFFISNAIKFMDGGYVPVFLALFLYAAMKIWEWGKNRLSVVYSPEGLTVRDLLDLKDIEWKVGIPRRINFFSPNPVTSLSSIIPLTLQTFVSRIHILPMELTFVTVRILNIPFSENGRTEKQLLGKGISSLILNYGYMEDPQILEMLNQEHFKGNIVVGDHEIFSDKSSRWLDFRVRIFRLFLRLSNPSYRYFGLQNQPRIMKEVIPVEFDKNKATLLDVDY
ncbi:KUP/HAK/KT family potassium transporter [bacterium]|nr:KUP/HAK/KT family potassium transporter [bacterium]